MGSAIEKITLYDFFGYLIPGLLFLIVSFGKIFIDMDENLMLIVKDFVGIFIAASILVAYVCGILLSEIARWIFSLFEKKFFNAEKIVERAGVNAKQLKNALVSSNLTSMSALDGVSCEDMVKKYMNSMFGVIQTHTAYKRIHDYASYATMCKNISAAFAVSMLWFIWNEIVGGVTIKLVTFFMLGVCSFIFGKRYMRFYEKKRIYTIIWFVTENVGA